jgi:hypothetical protein
VGNLFSKILPMGPVMSIIALKKPFQPFFVTKNSLETKNDPEKHTIVTNVISNVYEKYLDSSERPYISLGALE